MFHFCSLARALGDENRARILMALRRGPLCVCQITAFLDLAPSTTSKHLSILRHCRLIEGFKQGRWVYYRLPETPATPPVAGALDWLFRSLEGNAAITADTARIESILNAEAALDLEDKASCHSLQAHIVDANINPEEERS